MSEKNTTVEVESTGTVVESVEMPELIDTEGIVVIKQKPEIEEHLQRISDNILQQVAYAKSLECTEENKQEIKKLAKTIQKQFDDLEDKRKEVKKAVNEPYKRFEDTYKQYVTSQIKPAIAELRAKIAEVEDAQKKELENKAREYFEEYRASLGIDFVSFENVGLNIILSKSAKYYKTQCKEFLDKVDSDIQLINTQEYSDDIMVEYKQSLDCSGSIIKVKERYAAIEEEKRRREEAEERERAEAEHQAEIERAMAEAESDNEGEPSFDEHFAAPTAELLDNNGPVITDTPLDVEEQVQTHAETAAPQRFEVAFKVTGTVDDLRAMKQLFEERGMTYVQL